MEGSKMNLKNATLFLIVSVCYLFLVRTVSTIFPSVFMSSLIVRSVQILSLIANLGPVLFFYFFYKEYVTEDQPKLKRVTLLTLIGSGLLPLLYLRGLFMVFENLSMKLYQFSPHLYGVVHYQNIGLIGLMITFLVAVLFLLFLLFFLKEIEIDKNPLLFKAINFGIVGQSISLLLRLASFTQYFLLRNILGISMSPILMFIILLISIVGMFFNLYFLIIFYKLVPRE
jgi:hypothetical protein